MREVQSWIFKHKDMNDWYIFSLLSHNEYDLYDENDMDIVLYAADMTGSKVLSGKGSGPDIVHYYYGKKCYRAHKRDAFIVNVKLLHMHINGRVSTPL